MLNTLTAPFLVLNQDCATATLDVMIFSRDEVETFVGALQTCAPAARHQGWNTSGSTTSQCRPLRGNQSASAPPGPNGKQKSPEQLRKPNAKWPLKSRGRAEPHSGSRVYFSKPLLCAPGPPPTRPPAHFHPRARVNLKLHFQNAPAKKSWPLAALPGAMKGEEQSLSANIVQYPGTRSTGQGAGLEDKEVRCVFYGIPSAELKSRPKGFLARAARPARTAENHHVQLLTSHSYSMAKNREGLGLAQCDKFWSFSGSGRKSKNTPEQQSRTEGQPWQGHRQQTKRNCDCRKEEQPRRKIPREKTLRSEATVPVAKIEPDKVASSR